MFTDKMYELLKDLWGISKTARYPKFNNVVKRIHGKLWAKRDLRFRFIMHIEDHYDES